MTNGNFGRKKLIFLTRLGNCLMVRELQMESEGKNRSRNLENTLLISVLPLSSFCSASFLVQPIPIFPVMIIPPKVKRTFLHHLRIVKCPTYKLSGQTDRQNSSTEFSSPRYMYTRQPRLVLMLIFFNLEVVRYPGASSMCILGDS